MSTEYPPPPPPDRDRDEPPTAAEGETPVRYGKDVPPAAAAMQYPTHPAEGSGSTYAAAPEASDGSPGQGYPGYPSSPPAYPGGTGYEPVPPVPQPSSIRVAALLMYVGAALSVLSLIVGLATLGSLKDNIRSNLQSRGDFTAQNLDSAYNVAVAFVVIVAIIAIAIWLWMAWKNSQGRSWARIVATVLAGLNILSFLANLAQNQQTGGTTVLSVISVLLAIGILILLWRPESSAYYRSVSAARRAQYR